ncbi:MAG: hypothetical protein A4S17_04670 [Proteobacteria bacterium HN_bin10]|nr:MAG: hypothetical protein A4S17_04670 [Proteobacteria bacterium HN_bin10]
MLLDLVDHGFEIEADARELEIVRLRTQGVGFARQFLTEKVEPAARGLRLNNEAAEFGRVRGQALQFFLHVGAGGGDSRLLRQALGIELQLRRQAFEPLLDPLQRGGRRGGGRRARGCDQRLHAIG